MRRTQIYFPEAQLEELKDLAAAERLSLSETIRQLVGQKIPASLPKPKPAPKPQYRNAGEWLLAQAAWAERSGIKGPSDLASNLDDYLYGGK